MHVWFGMDTLRIDRAEEWPHVVRYWATSVHRPPCPACGSNGRTVYHAPGKSMTVADLPARGKPTRIEISRSRWKCGCAPGKTFSIREPGIHRRYRATERLIRYVENAVTKRPIADIAREVGMSTTTIGDLAHQLSVDLDANHRFPTPPIFSMDGLKMNGIEYMVFSDARTRFNTLPDNLEDDDPAGFEREEETMHAAMDVLDAAPAATWDEFADAFAIACEDGVVPPHPALLRKLLADVRRLSGRAPA